jgi:hypothetical protein
VDRRLPPLGRIAAAGMRGPAVPPIQRTCPAARVARLAGLSGNAAECKKTLSRSETRFRGVSWDSLRDQEWGWDYRGVLLSLVYRLVRCLTGP